jgi:hypothetical protein
MRRQLNVGDIVNAKDEDGEKLKTPISEITSGGTLFLVDDHYFFDYELTLVTPVDKPAHKRGVETYKDQFTPWELKLDVTSMPHIVTGDAQGVNRTIKRMLLEQ